jgi:hypothetical protein
MGEPGKMPVSISIPLLAKGLAMPKHDHTPEQIEAETDALLLEQAQAIIRELRAAARNAPYGKIIQRAEAFAVEHGREFTRQALETIVQEQNDLLEKKRNQAVRLRRKTRTSWTPQATNRKCHWCHYHSSNSRPTARASTRWKAGRRCVSGYFHAGSRAKA